MGSDNREGMSMLGSGSNKPPPDERMLAAALVALYPFALHGRPATKEELENWDQLRSRYLGLDHNGSSSTSSSSR